LASAWKIDADTMVTENGKISEVPEAAELWGDFEPRAKIN